MTPEQKLEGFETLMGEVSGALADLVEFAKEGRAPMDEIASSMADLVATLEKRKEQSLDALVAAVQALRIEAPVVNVNVSPTPFQNIIQPAQVKVELMPADNKGATWEITLPGRYGEPARTVTIKRTK